MRPITAAKRTLLTYLISISLSCSLTFFLNVIHSHYVLKLELQPESFAIPMLAGLIFGLMFAHILSLSNQLKKLAFTDSLTKIYNRLHFAHFLDIEIDKALRYKTPLSIIFFDLDHFKLINDTYGHKVGDDVLEEITQVVNSMNRSADIFARYGGEEFIILAPQTDISGALIHAERLRDKIAKHNFKTIGHLTSSFGVTEFKGEGDTIEELLDRADIALYQAKELGRNRVEKA